MTATLTVRAASSQMPPRFPGEHSVRDAAATAPERGPKARERRTPRLYMSVASETSFRHFEDRSDSSGSSRSYDAKPIPGARAHVFTARGAYERALWIGALGTTRASGQGNGVDVRLGCGFEVFPRFYAGAGVRYSFLSFPVVRVPSATVTDQYLTGELQVELTL
jgi:hypothetical protein